MNIGHWAVTERSVFGKGHEHLYSLYSHLTWVSPARYLQEFHFLLFLLKLPSQHANHYHYLGSCFHFLWQRSKPKEMNGKLCRVLQLSLQHTCTQCDCKTAISCVTESLTSGKSSRVLYLAIWLIWCSHSNTFKTEAKMLTFLEYWLNLPHVKSKCSGPFFTWQIRVYISNRCFSAK